jgi:hypothetical protein
MRLSLRPPAASSDPAFRRLGLKSSASIETPIRPQAVVAFAIGAAIVSLVLYLLREPPAESSGPVAPGPGAFVPVVPEPKAELAATDRLVLGQPERVRCSSGPTASGQTGRYCDALPYFEKALADAIKTALDCAPRSAPEGTLNFVLKIDFAQSSLHVFPGASGSWKGPQARRTTKCVKQAIVPPEWSKIPHQFRYYEMSILATYKPPSATSVPVFEEH